jgi:thiosulfate/3-mercaptopyruvate sulfurtransferase
MADPKDALVSTDWLAERLNAPDVRIVDGSWFLPDAGRDGKQEFAAAHIPGTVFFDIDDIADNDSGLPHTMPSPEKFSSRVRKLGLGDGGRIVAYDSGNWMAAARVWWMFRVFGHEDVSVLDGGLAKWRAEGRPVSDAPIMPRDRHFTARKNTFLLRDVEQLLANIDSGREQVVDVRAPGRFNGTEPEPRPGLRSGHIPGSLNLPFSGLFDGESKTLRDPDTLRTMITDAGIDLGRPIVTSCGSGVTACVAALALHLIGHRDIAVYDGSWTEWGSRDDLPIDS